MGGLFEKKTIGHRYLLGMHLVYCLGAVDKIVELKFEDQTAWRGAASGGLMFVDRPELFGGDEEGGGVSGYIDVEMGLSDQGKNNYLAGILGDKIPAWRGVTAMVFRQFYLGNSPHLKKPSAKIQRVYTTPDGQQNWLPDKAAIGGAVSVSDAAICIAMDGSGSMAGARMAAQKAAVIGLLELIRDNFDEKNDISLVMWGSLNVFSIQRRDCSVDDYNDLIDWVNAAPEYAGGTDFNAAVFGAKQFFDGGQETSPWGMSLLTNGFPLVGWVKRPVLSGDLGSGSKRRVFVFLTDGEASPVSTAQEAADTLHAIDAVEVYGVNIALTNTESTALLDNTPGDGVPVVDAENADALLDVFRNVFSNGLDYNPVHFLRDVILYPSVATTDQAANIGESFAVAANTLYAERFGISLKFQNPRARRENKAEIERHIDARVFRDRLTSKWEIKLIRDDYDPASLFVVGADNGISWTNFSWRDSQSLPNQITLTYRDHAEDKSVALTLTNPAKVQLAGRIINEPVTYDGIRNHDLAARVAARDLLALSSPLRSGTVMVFDLPADLNIGSPIILDNPRQGIRSAVYRIVDLKEGDGRANEIEISVVEEVFSLGEEPLTVRPPETPDTLKTEALPVLSRLVEEAPYYEIVRNLGQVDADALLADEPATGFINVMGQAPSGNALNAVISVDSGGGFGGSYLMEFASAAPLRSALSARADATTILVDLLPELQEIRIGSLASIGGEYVRVDKVEVYADAFQFDDAFAVADVFSKAAIITLGRGCLDTVPRIHAVGEVIFFWSDLPASNREEYFSGEAVSVKLITRTGADLLSQVDAPTDVIQLNQRAIRPYPPGDLRIDGGYADVLAVGDLAITWVGRDRTLQTTSVFEDHTAGNIGPEAGVTYRVRISAVSSSGAELMDLATVDVGALTAFTFNLDEYEFDAFRAVDAFALDDAFGSILPLATAAIKIEVLSFRAGFQCWQAPHVLALIFLPPSNGQLYSVDEITFLAPSNPTIMEIV